MNLLRFIINSTFIKVHVRYFALLREQAACLEEAVETSCETYGELYAQLAVKHSFTLARSMIRVAVNDEFSHLDAALVPGATVVFIPPVAGG